MMTWNLSLDGILTFASMLIFGGGVLWRMSSRFTGLEDGQKSLTSEMASVKMETSKIADAIISIAVQKTRIDQHEKMIDELRHGEGKVVPLKGAHEYPR